MSIPPSHSFPEFCQEGAEAEAVEISRAMSHFELGAQSLLLEAWSQSPEHQPCPGRDL